MVDETYCYRQILSTIENYPYSPFVLRHTPSKVPPATEWFAQYKGGRLNLS